MKRKPNRQAVEQRMIGERYGLAQRTHLYKRLSTGQPFGLFVIDGRLSITSYPSPRHTWLEVDHPTCLASVYIEMPDWSRILHDVEATEAALQAAAPRPAA